MPLAEELSRPVTAKAFRRWILRPAEGTFLFHPRAIERLQAPSHRDRVRSTTGLCYHLMARRIFLERLESENPEALSVIEGLSLPDWILLLPMPGASVLSSTAERTLLRDYWSRRFEGEIARAWQMARDDNQDLADFGPTALAVLVGGGAVLEAREILIRAGISGAAEGASELCRAFVARVVRLRYFAPGARGCYFPAVPDWAAVDRWLEESGLDLPAPVSGSRLPLALERGRPATTCGAPPVLLPFPPNLPFGRSDPDRRAAVNSRPEPPSDGLQYPASTTIPSHTATPLREAADKVPSEIQSSCLQALRRGASIKRSQGPLARIRENLEIVLSPLFAGLLEFWASVVNAVGALFRLSSFNRGLWARLAQLRYASAVAQRAEWDSRFATALRQLSNARRRYGRIATERPSHDPVERALDQRQWVAAESFANFLAVTWRLSHAATGDLSELIWRLVAQRGTAAPKAQALLDHLETVLLEGRTTYYRINLRIWLTQGRLRQVLPFQGTLKSLAALEAARQLLDELPWPVEDADRFGAPLASLAEHVGERLEVTLKPRIQDALDASDLAPDAPQGRLAAKRLMDALASLIRRRGHLKFADVRDLLNRDVLSLPDLSLAEVWKGDRLGRFDHAAADTLPGVYQRGEFYVKGLQRLGAPLFGTWIGRWTSRLLLLPGLAAWALLAVTAFVWGLFTPAVKHPSLTDPATIFLLSAALNAIANTHHGRNSVRVLWRALVGLIRFLFVTAPIEFLHWQPIAWLLGRRLVSGLLDRVLVPIALGLALLSPMVTLWILAMPESPGVAASMSVLAIAFAFGTLLRETPGGRRRLDDLTTGWHRLRDRIRHERFLNLIAPTLAFFKGIMRTFAEVLHRIRTRLSPRLGEPPQTTLVKGLAAPLWAACEAVIQFYAVVLIEPQLNPVKHFPAVTLGHKLMLPFLPSLSAALHASLASFLPEVILLPLVAATILLLPGAFGFLFWELKENWGLYGSNRAEPVPLARLGTHGETLNGMLHRGFHSGTIPKAFDQLREVLDWQIRQEAPEPRQLRRALGPLEEIDSVIAHFGEQELGAPLRDACPGWVVMMATPRIASQGMELCARLHPPDGAEPVELTLELSVRGADLTSTARFVGPVRDLGPECRGRVAEVVGQFAHRCGAVAEPIAILEKRMG